MYIIYNPPDICWHILNNTMSQYYLCFYHIFGLNGVDIWYIPPFKEAGLTRLTGSIAPTKAFTSFQQWVTHYITGGVNGTAGDIMEVHANTLPVDLLFCKVQFWAASHLCTLPKSHPLYNIVRKASTRLVNTHCSPLHFLFYTTRLHPNKVETIQPVWCQQTYRAAFNTVISADKESVLELANSTNRSLPIRVYSDGSRYKGGIGAAAILYKGNHIINKLHYYLGPDTKHTVYEGEVISITLGFQMLHKWNRQLTDTVLISSDNQASLKALNNQNTKPGHYLLDEVHDAAEALHAKQDKLFNARLHHDTRAWGDT